MRHVPVLLNEVVEGLALAPNMHIVDATVGDGGHAEKIAEAVGKNGVVYGIDQDPESLSRAAAFLQKYPQFTPVQGNFRQLKELISEPVDGILFDLGWSTPQFKERGRGFSFLTEEPLDMRMDPSQMITASDIVNAYNQKDIEYMLRVYGEEKHWKGIAHSICEARQSEPIITTQQLVHIIGGRHTGGIHPATRTFQALRIAVNDELNALKEGIEAAITLLKPAGRIAVISFHSLEDRIVKHAFKQSDQIDIVTKRPITPADKEIENNPRSRSAKLRIAEKVS